MTYSILEWIGTHILELAIKYSFQIAAKKQAVE